MSIIAKAAPFVGHEDSSKQARVFFKKVFSGLFHLVVVVYTFVTLPFYFLLQNPVAVRRKGELKRAEQLEPGNPYSPWKTIIHSTAKDYLTDHVSGIDDLISGLGGYFSLERPALGHRRVLEEEVLMEADGRTPRRIDGREIRKRVLSDYIWISYREMVDYRISIAKGLLLFGVNPRDKIVILCETSPEFLLMELAIAHAGAVQVNVFPTLGDDGIAHAIQETGAKVIFTSFELLEKTRGIIQGNELKGMKVIYSRRRCETPSKEEEVDGCRLITPFEGVTFTTFEEIKEMGNKLGDKVECRPLDKDEVTFIMYTSGTTGVPKGVQATSCQFIHLLRAMMPVFDYVIGTPEGSHMYVAFLPQAHIFEATIELMALALGAPIGFAHPHTLTDSGLGLATGVSSDLRLLRPTFMIAVPLVLERMRKDILTKLEARSEVSLALFNYLLEYKLYWTVRGYRTPIVNRFLCKKIRNIFGGRLGMIIFGSAPMSSSLQAFIKAALEINLIQGYGSTETLGGCICMDAADLSYGRCGAPLRGCLARLDNYEEGGYRVTDRPYPRGELIIGSRSISLNYLARDELNAESYQDDPGTKGVRWFRTGDIAEVWDDGTFKIIDRKKDLIKMPNGEYISLGKIESILKNNTDVDNICVFGNALANYLVALVIPNKARLETLRKKATSEAQLETLLLQSLTATGLANGLAKAERLTKVALVFDEWTPANGLLTAAMKLKRTAIKAHYSDLLDRLFAI